MHSRRNVLQHVGMVILLCLQVRETGAWAVAASSSASAAACQRSLFPTPFPQGSRRHATLIKGRRRPTRQLSAASGPLLAAVAAERAHNSALLEEQEKQSRPANKRATSSNLQSVDFTTALLMSRDLEKSIVPARIENAYQLDAHNVALQLRTLEGNMWLHVCWHPKGARFDESL